MWIPKLSSILQVRLNKGKIYIHVAAEDSLIRSFYKTVHRGTQTWLIDRWEERVQKVFNADASVPFSKQSKVGQFSFTGFLDWHCESTIELIFTLL